MTHGVLAEVVRSGFVESVHSGVAVAIDSGGASVMAVGDPERPILPRSANKPLQAAGMLRAGLVLDGALLALTAGSHSGERYQLDGVERMLAAAELPVSALQNTRGLPLDEQERTAWRLAGRAPSALAQNCSGKHAAMLVTCDENGWPVENYRAPEHPLQLQLRQTVAELAGEDVAATGVDGCGAPVFALSPLGLARAFARIATASAGTPEGRVAQAIRQYPEWVGGTGRGVTRLLRAVPGLIAKEGAEGVFAAALPDGRAVAVKIADGAERAAIPAVVALLRRLGVGNEAGNGPGNRADSETLDALAHVPVLGHGEPVGSLRTVI